MKPFLILSKINRKIHRNEFNINGDKSKLRKINLEWWSKKINLGDQLAPIVYAWMLEREGIKTDSANKVVHLLTIGSLIGMRDFDAVIWGSGIHCLGTTKAVIKNSKTVKYDIRAVRGPITKGILQCAGYTCNCIYGDPGVLMPFIYSPKATEKKYEYSIIRHLSGAKKNELSNLNMISIETNDYKYFIDEIVASKCIISSSLHGIILAEAYGVPAIFLNENMDNELLKYYDWYFSTNRMSVVVARTIEEAMEKTPMPLPDLTKMQSELLKSFPYDLYR